ncbi:MAG: TIGR00266 family protein [Clostridiales bacterium]|jgi:uncharacterized protein (TIGR00266 family)|nr:TIGR00266 family protein [Clostridiales bacterium]MDR2750419.1 TIGR00266 family protein [Clostridiales bacterium]
MKYSIIGEPMPVVQVELKAGESMKNESGSMVWMTPNMKMETNAGGGIGKAFGRMLSGESIFQNVYTAEGGEGMIAFGSTFPGSIRAVELSNGRSIVCQKRAFLASELGVEISLFFQKRFSAGLAGGEGFIMQKLSGNGTVFLEIDGSAVEYTLQANQSLIVDTGSLALIDETCTIEIATVKGVKNVLFGGEGLFNTKVTGPGKIVLQTLTISSLASAVLPYINSK